VTRIELRNVGKFYGDTRAVEAFDLEIGPGDFVVFVGPSGCGKSTTLRMIAGLEEISEGELVIDGEDHTHTPPSRRGFSMVFQDYALYPHFTAYENMALGLRIQGLPATEIESRVRKAAADLELEPLLDRRPANMSGGQRQRVAMGRAMVKDPVAFLFDEPLSNLDAKLRTQMREVVSELFEKSGRPCIYVTHDQIEAMTLATRIVVLSAGKIQQTGAPMALYDDPANRFVAGFLGTPTMNFLDLDRDGDTWRDADGGGHSVQLAEDPGEAIVLGVRPEHLVPVAEAAGEGGLRGDLVRVEATGSQTFLHVDAAGGRVVASVDPKLGAAQERGALLTLAYQPENARYFAPGPEGARLR
jgi:ABC-type sugar transport system ATPase subunit